MAVPMTVVDVTAANAHEVLGKWILPSGMPLIWDPAKSHGPYLHCGKSGVDYLDLFSFFATRPLAFNHPKLTDPAFREKLGSLAAHKPSNCDVYTVEYAKFIDSMGRVAFGGEFEHIFVIEGGSPAVENALKTAMDWKHRRNLAAGKGPKGTEIAHFRECFHGRTGYCLSLTDSHDVRKTQYFPKFDWPRLSNPKLRFPFTEAALADVEEREMAALKELDAAFEQRQDQIAAVIIEPIQGEGGDNYFRSEFLRQLRKRCNEQEALLIFDEIQTGFGATGRWWDWQHHNVKPDIVVFGKKTQVCGFAATSRIDEIDSVFKVPSRISSTFEGSLVDMVRCQRIIEIIEEEDLLDNVASMGSYLLKLLHELAEGHRSLSNVRGRGLWAAMDLPTPDERDRLVQACFEEELLILPCGTHSVRVRPALDIEADALGRGVAQLEAGLRRAYA